MGYPTADDLDGRTVRCTVCGDPVANCPLEDAEDAICTDCGFDRMDALGIEATR